MPRPAFLRDWTEIVAATWLLVAIAGTAVFAPHLGMRGWAWIAVHDLLCLVGVTWEATQAWRRHQERLATAPGRRITP